MLFVTQRMSLHCVLVFPLANRDLNTCMVQNVVFLQTDPLKPKYAAVLTQSSDICIIGTTVIQSVPVE